MNLRSIQTTLLSALAVAASSAVSLAGCGGSFDVPKDHFDGVDSFGYVSYWNKIADIDIGEDTPLPLVIGFKSNRETSSPYLGHGWVMPLLDSYMIQTGENTFEIMKPTGYTSGFGRDPKNTTAIGGVKGWKGEIGSNTIKVWAPCGWSLTYSMGRLTEMGTPKGKKVLVKRDQAGQVEDVTMDGRVLLKVVKGLGGAIAGVDVEGKMHAIEMGEKPRVQNIAGNNVIAGKDASLASILIADESRVPLREFSYGVDNEFQLKMIVNRDGQGKREIVWNPSNYIIVKDGEWTYENKNTDTGSASLIELKRINSQGKIEKWCHDQEYGVESQTNPDGSVVKTTRFVGGALSGKIRRQEYSKPSQKPHIRELSYDQNGKIIREKRGELVRYFIRDENKLTISDVVNGKNVRMAYQIDGIVMRETWNDGKNRKTWIHNADSEFAILLSSISPNASPSDAKIVEIYESEAGELSCKYMTIADGWITTSTSLAISKLTNMHLTSPKSLTIHENNKSN